MFSNTTLDQARLASAWLTRVEDMGLGKKDKEANTFAVLKSIEHLTDWKSHGLEMAITLNHIAGSVGVQSSRIKNLVDKLQVILLNHLKDWRRHVQGNFGNLEKLCGIACKHPDAPRVREEMLNWALKSAWKDDPHKLKKLKRLKRVSG